MSEAEYQLVCADSSRMDLVKDDEADLVLTSPPYFPDSVLDQLENPRPKQRNYSEVQSAILGYGRGLEPVFREISRILRPGRAAILQTKDLRYGDSLIALTSLHREMMELVGFRLVTQILWQRPFLSRDPTRSFQRHPTVGGFRASPLEYFLVFAFSGELEKRASSVDLSEEELAECCSSVWTLPPSRDRLAHRFASPPGALRRLVALYSEPGELVVDPFLGHGTTVKAALRLGRRAIGYDVDPSCVRTADDLILDRASDRSL
jgi:DNA modification methylase